MTATGPVVSAQFARRTTLAPNERRINFHQIDHDVIVAVSSDEAAKVTDKMSKIYLRLVAAPRQFWQAEGVLCFAGEARGDAWATGYEQMLELLGVSAATAAKALTWMKEQGIIGYNSPKNGHPTRIWLNRATGSIASKPETGRPNLRLVKPAESEDKANLFFSPPASKNEPAFKEVISEHGSRNYLPSHADAREISSSATHFPPQPFVAAQNLPTQEMEALFSKLDQLRAEVAQKPSSGNLLAAVSAAVRAEIEDQLAYQFTQTRAWFNDKAIPQAARISQAETFKILEKQGALPSKSNTRAGLYVGAPSKTATDQLTSTTLNQPEPDHALQWAEAVWLIADLQRTDLETAISRVLAENSQHNDCRLDTSFEQALRAAVYGQEIHEYIRRKLEWWNPSPEALEGKRAAACAEPVSALSNRSAGFITG